MDECCSRGDGDREWITVDRNGRWMKREKRRKRV